MRSRLALARAALVALVALVAPLAGALTLLAAASAAAATGTPAAPSAVRTVTQDLRGATFEVTPDAALFDTLDSGGTIYSRVTMRGAVMVEPAGRPALPTMTLHAAIPDGMSPRLRVVSEEWTDRVAPPPVPATRQVFVSDNPRTGPVSEYRIEPDPAIYRGAAIYPPAAAAVGSGALVGQWWVAPIHVRPVRWNPATGSYRVLRKMSLAVDFVPATDQERRLRPALRPRAQAAVWDRVQRGLVKNYEAARSFPIRPPAGAVAPLGRGSALGARSRFAANPEFKLRVAQTGWTSVSYATLASVGFPSNISIDLIGIEERSYDDVGDSATAVPIPVVARDVNTNGIFDGGDAITFYGRNLRERVGIGNIENRYTNENVYWLSWGVNPALTPGLISGIIPGASPAPTSFRDVIRLEENNFIHTSPDPTAASPPEAVEHSFWTDGTEPSFDVPIPFAAHDPSQNFRIRSRYQGRNGSTHFLDMYFQGGGNVTDTLAIGDAFFNQDAFLFDSGFTIPGSLIGGLNRYRYVGTRQAGGGGIQNGSGSLFDVLEVTYSRLYQAVGNTLRFTSGSATGVTDLSVSGFTSESIEIFDVTNPQAPLRVSPVPVGVGPPGGPFTALFQTDATGGERRFVALVPGSESPLGAGSVAADQASDLRTPGAFSSSNTARSIIIAPEAFRTAADRLADYRRGQGYVVEVANVEDAYDEFTGGNKSAAAIRRYLRHAYLAWTPPPSFVILAGDASLDYKHVTPGSGADWVPTYLNFEPITGPSGNELVAHDSYYFLDLVNPSPSNFVPSLFLGRIPASSAADLDLFVTKLIAYEDFQPTDTWRGRQLLVSDDEYSSTIFFAAGYCIQPQEDQFKAANQQMAATAAASTGGQDIQTDFFDLKTYTDQLAATCQAGPDPSCRQPNCIANGLRTTGGAVSQLHQRIGVGSLILNFQGHANRYLITHEYLFCSAPLGGCPTPDYDLISNFNRPAFLMVWGCHSNQFPDGPVGLGSIDSTDATGEQWLLLPNRGSIASFGSGAYEFLQTNATYNGFISNAFYSIPPAPDPAPGMPRQARWILGEVMGEAAVANAMTGFQTQQLMNTTLNLLGDPMLRMDALPPRVFEATLDAATVGDLAPFTSDSPTDSVTLVARLRDEVGIASARLVERDISTGALTPVDSTTYTVAFTDSSRLAQLTGRVRPHVGNYDLQVRGTDVNGRLQTFALQVRTPIVYFANGVEIVNNVFVESGALLRAEVISPIPLTADSLELLLDGVPISATKSQTDLAGRRWALESLAGNRGTGSHTIQVALSGRTAGLDERTFQVTSEFTLRGVAVVSQRVQGTGCGGQVFQYELSGGARKVELLILSVSGRRIASLDLPRQAGYNVYCWDGRDGQGHEAATGVYFYRVKATDPGGRTVTRDGRMIRSR